MTKHRWVELQYIPVEVEEVTMPDGEVTMAITSEDGADDVAKEEAMHGCWFCNTPLTLENHDDECPGADDSK